MRDVGSDLSGLAANPLLRVVAGVNGSVARRRRSRSWASTSRMAEAAMNSFGGTDRGADPPPLPRQSDRPDR